MNDHTIGDANELIANDEMTRPMTFWRFTVSVKLEVEEHTTKNGEYFYLFIVSGLG